MPFKSDAQRRYLWSQKPDVARKFAEHKSMGGPTMDERKPAKVTQKDRYGNQVTYEYTPEVKPLDPTKLAEKAMEQGVDGIGIQMPEIDHPGEPMGTDTVPAWLTPGEFVVNAEAARMYGPQIEAMNEEGKAVQQMQGGSIPAMSTGGHVDYHGGPHHPAQARDHEMHSNHMMYQGGGPVPFLAGPMLTEPQYQDDGGWITDSLLDRLAEVESGGRNDAVSPVGALGMYQWMPKSAAKAGYGVKPFDPLDPKAARKATAQYLKNMQKYHKFTPEETLRAYNWGPGNVIKHKKGTRKDIPDEALNYPGKILGFDKVEGVPAPAGMPIPMPRPPREMPPMPTPRPKQESGGWKDFLNKYVLGPKTQYAAEGEYIDPIRNMVPQSNVVPPLTDVSKGHQMFGGNENFAGKVQQGPPPKEDPWYAPLLGHKSKEALGLDLDENEARLYHEANPSLVGDDPVNEIEEEVEGGAAALANDPMEKAINKMQVDDFKEFTKTPEGKGEVSNDIATDVAVNNAEKTGEAQTGPDKDQAGENKTDEEVKAAGEKTDNSFKSSALSALKGAFGDLFDKKELARMAIMYAGSRALGYSHGGSLQYAAKNYVSRVDAKVAGKNKEIKDLVKSGKYTPQSIQNYKESGNLADLQTPGSPVTRTGTYKTFYGPGGKEIKAEQVKVGKNTYWESGGKRIDGRQYNENPANVRGTKEWQTKFNNYKKETKDQIKELKDTYGAIKTDKGTTYKTDILPTGSAHAIAEWADKYNVEPNKLQGYVSSAYHDALNDKRQDGERIKSLVPYLENLVIREETGVPNAFVSKSYNEDKKGPVRYINAEKLQTLNANVGYLMQQNGFNGTPKNLADMFYTAAIKDWNALSTDEQKQYIRRATDDESGFYVFANDKSKKLYTK